MTAPPAPGPSRPGPSPAEINARADAAAAAVTARHLRRVACLPGTRIGRASWPPPGPPLSVPRLSESWHYWWQAHLLDLFVDAAIHRPGGAAAAQTVRLVRGIRLRNGGRWTNAYYDDMAWLGLAVERAGRHLGGATGRRHRRGLDRLTGTLFDAWCPQAGGGIPWRESDLFFNTPANGPATILLARTGRLDRAEEMGDWLFDTLLDPATGLINDGIRFPGFAGTASPGPITTKYSYCQGVALGAALELLRLTGAARWRDRIGELLDAVVQRLCTDGVIIGAGGGDGGLFAGILARYLALLATDLPGDSGTDQQIRAQAAGLVRASAEAAWRNRVTSGAGPVFGPDWRRRAEPPVNRGLRARSIDGAVAGSTSAERDLAVQLSGWLVLEADAAVALGGAEHDRLGTG